MVVDDPASCANFKQVKLEKLEVQWRVDFDTKTLEGETTQTFRTLQDNVKSVNLDCRDMRIEKVEVNEHDAEYTRTAQYENKAVFGDNLAVLIDQLPMGSEIKIHIRFKTCPEASALQWMSKEQTTDHIEPQVFTYSQAISGRTLLPCMDTPSVKCPVFSKLSVPSSVIALMAAIQVGDTVEDKTRSGYNVYTYEQTVPIPSYLISFIVGVFESREISHRIRVWAEPSMVQKAEYEVADSEKTLSMAENMFGEYVWKRCDMVVLPKSFPVGGMENPCLIFMNPTVITGDRSEMVLLIHEQLHSWWGNFVTNARWGDMWLNEGFTTYFERRFGAMLYGEKYRQFCNTKAWSCYLMPIVFEQFSPDHPFTQLVQDHSGGVDPSEAFSMVYYEKGQALLYYLESKIGQKDFDDYCRDYLKTFALGSVDTHKWLKHFSAYFKDRHHLLEGIDFDVWLCGRGMPPWKPQYENAMQRECEEYAQTWTNGTDVQIKRDKDHLIRTYNKFIPVQRIEFLAQLRTNNVALAGGRIDTLQEYFDFNCCTYCEVSHQWIRLGIRSRWQPIIPVAFKYITEFGRLKIIRPIYRDLNAWPEVKERCVELFNNNIPYMHSRTVDQIKRDLKL